MLTIRNRQSNMELLRIIAILFIIAFHFADHAVIRPTWGMPINIDCVILYFASIGGDIGNCVFVLITGYFMWQHKFNLRNLVKLWFEVFFYSIISFFIAHKLGFIGQNFSTELIKSLLPITHNQYWFASTYFILFLISPGLNILIDKINQRQHLYLIAGTIIGILIWMKSSQNYWLGMWFNIISFILLYLIGAYIAKYKRIGMRINKFNLLIVIFLICGIWFLNLTTKMVYPHLINENLVFWCLDKILPITACIYLLIYFSRLKINQTPKINLIASTTFGCYLFHIGKLWPLFFRDWFSIERTYGTGLIFPQMILAVVTIFLLSFLIDIIRQLLIERPLLKLIDK